MGPDHLRAATADDLAEHHDILEHGPGPVTRAVTGLALGLVAGAAAALLTPRDRPRDRERV